MNAISAFFSILKTTLAARMAYRADFLISAVMVLIGELLIPLVTMLIYRSGGTFPGWSIGEAILIQAIFMLAKGISFPLFFGMVGNTLFHVREGTYDLFLIRPKSALYMTVVTSFQKDGIGRLLGGLALFLYALSNITPPNLMQWLQFILLLGCAILSLFAYALFMSGIVFQWVGSSRVFEIFDAITLFGMYPKSIFNPSFQWIVSFVLPVAVIGFYPASALLGRELSGVFWTSGVVIVVAGASLVFWNYMLSKYTSAGG